VALFTALSFIKRKPKSHRQLEEVAENAFFDNEYNEWDSVLQQLKKFPEMDKTLIFLYLEDKSYREIGEIIGISETNVGVKLNRIKKKLKEHFTE
jgi:RNA polymerase sigma-70 factor (ECF subfamily)